QGVRPLEPMVAWGLVTAPPALAVAATPSEIATGAATPRHPPGYYGRGNTRRALNIAAGVTTYSALGAMPFGVIETGFVRSPEVDLKPWLLALVAALLVVDLVIALALPGLLGWRP